MQRRRRWGVDLLCHLSKVEETAKDLVRKEEDLEVTSYLTSCLHSCEILQRVDVVQI